MADKAISELVSAEQITATDMFVLEQNGTAKKLTAQVLENWLLSFSDGHGGIQRHELLKTEGLVKTYRFTLTDQTYVDIDVVDGRGIESVKPTATNGLVVTYTITYNDGTTSTFTVTNGAKGDKGDRADIWVKYASQKPTASSHSFGDVPDSWIGIATGHNMDAAPTDWKAYDWFQWKGEKGDTGEPAVRLSVTTAYQVGDAGNINPSGSWLSSIPYVVPGKYLWIRKTTVWNKGDPDVDYSVSRMGIDGSGAVSTVAGVAPDANGNVPLDASSVKALPIGGGTMEGAINMNGKPIGGLNDPTANDQAANMGFVNGQVKRAAPRNLLDNSYFVYPINRRGVTSFVNAYGIDRWFATGVATVNAGSVAVGDTMDQYIELSAVKNCMHTIAAMKTDGTVVLYCRNPHDSYDANGALGLGYYSGNGKVIARLFAGEYIWAALYEGEYTADILPAFQRKRYTEEFTECGRYFKKLYLVGQPGVFISDTVFRTSLPGVNMRAAPTVIPINLDSVIYNSDGSNPTVLGVIECTASGTDPVYLDIITTGGGKQFAAGALFACSIQLSADL